MPSITYLGIGQMHERFIHTPFEGYAIVYDYTAYDQLAPAARTSLKLINVQERLIIKHLPFLHSGDYK
jgi:hypothetical protein